MFFLVWHNSFDFNRKKIHKNHKKSDKPSFKSKAWILKKKERQRRQVRFSYRKEIEVFYKGKRGQR